MTIMKNTINRVEAGLGIGLPAIIIGRITRSFVRFKSLALDFDSGD